MATYKIYIFKTALNSVNFLYIKSIFDITFTNRENIFTLVRASLSETQPQNETFIEIVKTAFSKKKKTPVRYMYMQL